MNIEIDKTKLSRMQSVINSIARTSDEEDPDIGFEFIMASCFPTIWNNIQKKLKDEHMAGYLEGLEAGKNLNQD